MSKCRSATFFRKDDGEDLRTQELASFVKYNDRTTFQQSPMEDKRHATLSMKLGWRFSSDPRMKKM
jgi:hypothetical protein